MTNVIVLHLRWGTAFKNLDFQQLSGVLRGTKLQEVLIRGSNIEIGTNEYGEAGEEDG